MGRGTNQTFKAFQENTGKFSLNRPMPNFGPPFGHRRAPAPELVGVEMSIQRVDQSAWTRSILMGLDICRGLDRGQFSRPRSVLVWMIYMSRKGGMFIRTFVSWFRCWPDEPRAQYIPKSSHLPSYLLHFVWKQSGVNIKKSISSRRLYIYVHAYAMSTFPKT